MPLQTTVLALSNLFDKALRRKARLPDPIRKRHAHGATRSTERPGHFATVGRKKFWRTPKLIGINRSQTASPFFTKVKEHLGKYTQHRLFLALQPKGCQYDISDYIYYFL